MDQNPQQERRLHPQLREIYDEAQERVDQFFHHRHEWAGSSINYLSQRVIHEAWPHLHGDEVLLLSGAIERSHKAMADESAWMDDVVTHYTHHAVL